MLLKRVQAALSTAYEIESEVGGGGMGHVFVARDRVLDRRVAIKVVRPELATASTIERFTREAKLLARLQHPNIVTIHNAGAADGLFYLVMDLVEGETLSTRLQRGPLSGDEAVRMGLGILGALEAAHGEGIVHRDVKPSNIFFDGQRVVLADFGIARSAVEDGDPLTQGPLGTPGYMAPEQAAGCTPTLATDLYATGAVLFEAVTGVRYQASDRLDEAAWSRVPRRLRPALRRALAFAPGERWQDAASFAKALGVAGARAHKPLLIGLAAAGLAAGFVGVLVFTRGSGEHANDPAGYDLAILPFTAVGVSDTLAEDIAELATLALEDVPDLRIAPTRRTLRWWTRARRVGSASTPDTHRALRSARIASGSVAPAGDSLLVSVVIRDSTGRGLPTIDIRGRGTDLIGLSRGVAQAVANQLQPRLIQIRDRFTGTRWEVVREWLRGEQSFHADDWAGAESHYLAALALDSTFAPAWWGLLNARRWLPGHPEPDHSRMGNLDLRSLSRADSMLLAASLLTGEGRLAVYQRVRETHPNDAYAELLYGDELLHRGPLLGRSAEDAAASLLDAGRKDPQLSPAHEHAAWALIRLGRRAEAAAAVRQLERVAGRFVSGDQPDYPALIRHAYLERFAPDSARPARALLLDAGIRAWPELLAFTVRVGLGFDVPQTQREVAAALAARADAPSRLRAIAYQAEGLALLALGRGEEAVTRFDAAASRFGRDSAEVRFQSTEWVVVSAALGWDVIPSRMRASLDQLREAAARNGTHGRRARWVLALHAAAIGDTATAAEWRSRFEQELGPGVGGMRTLLEAEAIARAGRPDEALQLTNALLDYDSLRRALDPFFRSVLYLRRGHWWEALAEPDSAERAWRWAENVDIQVWLDGPAEAVEVDWVLGIYTATARFRLARQRADSAEACRHLNRLRRYWSEAEPFAASLLRAAETVPNGQCR